MSKSLKEKERILLEKLEKAKSDLKRLKNKRRAEIGELAMKAGLDSVDNDILLKRFNQLASELAR